MSKEKDVKEAVRAGKKAVLFTEELMTLITKHFPDAYAGDPGQLGTLSAAMSDNIGSLLAVIRVAGGEKSFRSALELTKKTIEASALSISKDLLTTKDLVNNTKH